MKSKTPQVVEIHNPRSFGQRYGQQLSRDTLEQFREKNRKGKLKQPAQVDDLALLSTSATVSAPTTIPATISAIQKEKIKVCYYARVSSQMASQQSSIDNQEIHFEDYIKANPDWEYVGSYIDQGITGTKAEVRPELQRLLQDCQDGHIDLVLTKSISRLARNLTDCLEIVRTLKDLGVAIYFEREKIDTGKMGSEFILSMYACIAEEESHSISGNMKWSIRKRFKDGTYQQTLAPYGYDRVDGKLIDGKRTEGKIVINEEEAAIVRRIYDMVLKGNGMGTIARTLNDEKIPSPTGGVWTDSTLRKLVANPVYVGDMLFQKTYKNERFQQVKNNGELDQYYDSDHHEPIISREDFDNAQSAVAQRARGVGYNDDTVNQRGKQRYCFTGILRCQACGETMHRQVWRNKSDRKDRNKKNDKIDNKDTKGTKDKIYKNNNKVTSNTA